MPTRFIFCPRPQNTNLRVSYNSVIFSSRPSFHYNVLHISASALVLNAPTRYAYSQLRVARDLALSDKVVRMDSAACIDAYAEEFQTQHGNVALVVAQDFRNYSTYDWTDQAELFRSVDLDSKFSSGPYAWICGQIDRSLGDKRGCDEMIPEIKRNETGWAPFGKKVEYCLSERVEQHCKLRFSTAAAAIVIAINAVKVVFIGVCAFGMREKPLLTMGDAVASFLENPDSETKDMCLASKSDIVRWRKTWGSRLMTFRAVRRRWYSAASSRRWAWNMML